MQDFIDAAAGIFHVAAAGTLGIFAGAMLTEALVLVPYWRSLKADAFYAWYGDNGRRLVGYFGAVTWLAGIAALTSAGASVSAGHSGTPFAVTAFALALAAVSLFPLYFTRANASFAAAAMSADTLRAELARWERWHRVRTGLSLGALTAALAAI
jgi:Domain of unknown function (DUF1772)